MTAEICKIFICLIDITMSSKSSTQDVLEEATRALEKATLALEEAKRELEEANHKLDETARKYAEAEREEAERRFFMSCLSSEVVEEKTSAECETTIEKVMPRNAARRAKRKAQKAQKAQKAEEEKEAQRIRKNSADLLVFAEFFLIHWASFSSSAF